MSEDRLPELFAEATELEASARSELVRRVTAEDAQLGRELARLLAAWETDSSPLDGSPWRDWIDAPEEETTPPERIGPYRILRELGRGGMGRVYLAEEETADFRRTVALKVIDRPAPGAEATRRFRDEVRILASLEHPGIARFLHGGRATDGTWYLALEHIEGEDLISHAEGRGLSVRARVELFLAVLEAVAFAHQRGVVHRDIKPGHLLVGSDGRPRLLDFGIAKLLDAGETQGATLTRTESRALTPAYASPEQFRGERASPASDVYSLGVVLYELLAGRRPFEPAADSRLALERWVLEDDPPPPSTVARRTAATTGDPTPGAPAGERSRAAGVTRDLDAICLKALRKEPSARYATAGALAEDLRRFLAGLPVAARRGGWRYRLGRFASRHRGELATAAALLVALAAIAVAVANRSGRAAGDGTASAGLAAPPAQAFPFSGVGAEDLEALERRFALAPADVEAGAALALAHAAADRLGEAQLVVARLRQIPGREQDPLTDYVAATIAQRLDEPQRALVLFTRARDTARAGGRGELLAQIRASRGRVLSLLGERTEAIAEMERARADFARAGDEPSHARVTNDLAIEYLQRGEMERGRALLEEALAAARARGSSGGNILLNLGIVEAELGRPDLALPHLREVVALRRDGGSPRQLATALLALAGTLADLPSKEAAMEAEAVLGESVDVARASSEVTVLAEALFAQAEHALARGRLAGIDETIEEIEAAAVSSGRSTGLALTHQLRGRRAALRGELAAARHHLAEARRLLLAGGELARATVTDLIAAEAELEAGDPPAAVRLLGEGIRRLEGGSGHVVAYRAEALRVRATAELGALGRARALLAELEDAAASPSLDRRLAYLEARAAVARREGQLAPARADLEAALAAVVAAHRTVEALRLRVELAELDASQGASARAEGAARSAATEAASLGLLALARRATRVAERAGTPAPVRDSGERRDSS